MFNMIDGDGSQVFAVLSGNLLKIVESKPTYIALTIIGSYVAYKVVVGIHHEFYGSATVKHDVMHRSSGNGERLEPSSNTTD